MGGWIVSAAAIVIHLFVHSLILIGSDRDTFRSTALKTVLVSHALFVGAFLLSYDYDDADGGLVLGRLFDAGSFWLGSAAGMFWNIIVLIPVCISWIGLLKKFRKR